MIIGKREFKDGKTYIMGILNVTPDSFSDGGAHTSLSAALRHAEKMINDGADVIDIGGESTRPGYTPVSETEESERIAPVIEAIKKNFDIPVSADTYKSYVAKAAIDAGADMINDIWGLKGDKYMPKLIGDKKVSVCLMHNRKNSDYSSFLNDIISDLRESIEIAEKNNIAKDRILIDPGIGFAKSYEENLKITNNLELLKELDFPILYGASRKSMIGITLDLPVESRLEGTIATTVIAAIKGAMFVRVHDVKENLRAIKMTEAILKGSSD